MSLKLVDKPDYTITGNVSNQYGVTDKYGRCVAMLYGATARSTFVIGASAQKLSVYDADSRQYLCGTIGELEIGPDYAA